MIEILALTMAAATGPDPRCAERVGFYQPSRGVVGTPRIAADVARLYLEAVYGTSQIARQLPLGVSISREVWYVRGVLPRATVGGVAEIEICQSTGKVLRITHGK